MVNITKVLKTKKSANYIRVSGLNRGLQADTHKLADNRTRNEDLQVDN